MNLNRENFIELIQVKEFDKKAFIELTLVDESISDIVVKNMLTHPKIMVYYHCYEVLKEGSKISPEIFVKYKPEFINLLKHKNSYHRDFGLTLLGNLTAYLPDTDFMKFSSAYFRCLKDEKMMTAECCLTNLKKIVENRPQYTTLITDRIIQRENFNRYRDKQRELIYSYVIDILEISIKQGYSKDTVIGYLSERLKSVSPKTRKIASRIYKKLSTH